MLIREYMNEMERIAPPEFAEPWDNVGLLCGDPEADANTVLVALDATPGAIREAAKHGAGLMITHHPLVFTPLKTLREDTYEGGLLCELIRHNIALYAAHTNLDVAPQGVNAALADCFGLTNREKDGFVIAGDAAPLTAGELLAKAKQELNPETILYGDARARITRVAVSSGGGGSFYEQAARMGAQAFIIGEIHHHEILRCMALGLQVLVAGHAATERVVLAPLAKQLQNALGCKTIVYDGMEEHC